MVKRKSTGGDSAKPPKSQNTKRLSAEQTKEHPYISKLTEWLETTVWPQGGPDEYLTKKYPDKDAMMEFAGWLDQFCPADHSLTYAVDYQGSTHLRPYMLCWRADAGCSGYLEPEISLVIMELMALEGFISSPEIPGAKKVSCTKIPAAFLTSDFQELPSLPGTQFVPCFSIGYTKGWKRSLMLLITLQGVRELSIESEIPHAIKVSYGTIHATFTNYKDIRSQVYANRGAGLIEDATAVRPNVFSLRRQVLIVQKAGGGTAERQLAEWASATSSARAFQLGRNEKAALVNLLTKVPEEAVAFLERSVKVRGMNRYFSNEVIGRDLLNLNYSSASGVTEAWKDQLRNTSDNKLVMLFLQRLEQDFDSLPPSMRKANSFQQATAKHQATGVFLHFLKEFEKVCPAGQFQAASESLLSQFKSGYLDCDLQHCLESQVPPADMAAISGFRPLVAAIHKSKRAQHEARELQIEQELRQADLKAVLAKLEQDMCMLEERMPSEEAEALKHAKDMRYLSWRQQKGQVYVEEWMQRNCSLILVDESYQGAVAGFLRFREQFRGRTGQEFVICAFDGTVWPSNANVVTNAIGIISQLLGMSSNHMSFVQYPTMHAQTTLQAMVKHRHLLDIQLMKQPVTLHNNVQILYSKSDSRSNDSRNLSQPSLCGFHSNYADCAFHSSDAVKEGKLGPCPLIKVSDFLNYDECSKPGAAARCEQKGLPCAMAMVNGLLKGVPMEGEHRVLFIDVVPNQYCEFGRALVQNAWDEDRRNAIHYVGFWTSEQMSKNQKALREIVYQGWDNMSGSPAKSRPPDEAEPVETVPDLQLLAWQDSAPRWPVTLDTKFNEGTDEYSELMKKKEAFTMKFPAAAQQTTTRSSRVAGRAGGLCDYAVDNGRQPIDISREISLPHVADSDFTESRLGFVEGKNGKPHIVVTSAFHVWIGNPHDNDGLNVQSQELFGFGLGEYEEKEIRSGAVEKQTLPWRLTSDMDMISYGKKAQPLCQFLRWLAIEKGIGELKVEDHVLGNRFHPAENGQEQMPVTFRYTLEPKESMVTHVFRPKEANSRDDNKSFKAQSLGAVFHQNYDKVISNKRASLVWEVDFSSSPPSVVAAKPKVYLLCSLHLPARTWVNLSK